MREFDLIDAMVARAPTLPPSVAVGPGDDMAVVRIADGEARALEFRAAVARHPGGAARAWRSAGEAAGARLRARLFADATSAAGVGSPLERPRDEGLASVLGMVLPSDGTETDALELASGVAAALAPRGLPIVGGDVAMAGRGGVALVGLAGVAASAHGEPRAGAIRANELPDGQFLLACDGAIAGRHVPAACGMRALARKAVLRNLSDVAAMGAARPIAIVASIALPPDAPADAPGVIESELSASAARFGVALVDVDHDRGPDDAPRLAPPGAFARDSVARTAWISVAILAAKIRPGARLALRSDARLGDGVYVTGEIGGAWDPATGLGRHLDFTPRLAAAHALSDALGDRLGAMLDVSDGLGRDLAHVADASRVDLELDLRAIPVGRGMDPWRAIGHGEDYELAFTARGDVPTEVAGTRVTRIGSVVSRQGRRSVVLARDEARALDVRDFGYEHGGAAP